MLGASFGERALTRRRFLGAVAGTVGAIGAGFLWPTPAWAAGNAMPRPIPGGSANPTGGPFIHQNFPGPADAHPIFGNEPSLITDFNGSIAVAHVQGTGTGTNTRTHASFPLLYDADLRVMHGTYRGVDGRMHQGTFGFI
jgi:hypothetical protein